ncbi:unnamed protein product [Ectocarpus sp. CCAP 1310/34]|nr:unnamed protein product [Ectocarpus sp. CCAP 1310/34]
MPSPRSEQRSKKSKEAFWQTPSCKARQAAREQEEGYEQRHPGDGTMEEPATDPQAQVSRGDLDSEKGPESADDNDQVDTRQPLNYKPLSHRKLKDYNEGLAKRGVVYLSRVPPFMKPAKVKHLMEQHGVVTRVYLVEEDQANRRARKKGGGNSGKRYAEGWVEFEDKKIARATAESLNNTLIGGRKRNYYHDDMWNLKYLRKFKWDHLTEKVAYERRVRSQKLRLETMQAKRENARYVELVESGRSFAKMEERKRKRRQDGSDDNNSASAASTIGGGSPAAVAAAKLTAGGGEGVPGNPAPAGVGDSHRRIRRRFKQSNPVGDVGGGGGGGMDAKVLRSLFGGDDGGVRRRTGNNEDG